MVMVRWDPFRDAVSLGDAMDRLFAGTYVRPVRATAPSRDVVWVLPVDAYETTESVVVRAALPGAKPEDVDINVTGDTLTITARVGSEARKAEDKKQNWLCGELCYGEFARTLTLPVAVEAGKAEARFEDGVLTLTLPKAEKVKPKQIRIQPREQVAAR